MYVDNENITADRILVDKVLGGDTDAFTLILKNTEGLVTQIVFRMIPVGEDRKDLAQDIYVKAFQNLKGFRFQSKLSTWIGQIAYNTCVNYLEKKKLVLLENDSAENEVAGEALDLLTNRTYASGTETETLLFRKGLSEILKNEIDKLSPVYKILITLYHNEELSYSEIAEITKLPAGTVKNYLFRARRILRDNLLRSYKKEAL